MTKSKDPIAFPELESDRMAIEHFVRTGNARTLAAFTDAQYEHDVLLATNLLENPDKINGISRRGKWVYTFRQTAENPCGVWLRLPQDQKVDPKADWETVFDLDAYCAESGKIWHWRGAVTPLFSSAQVMLCLSDGGSDQCQYLEFDLEIKAAVPNGFALPASRSEVVWLTPDCLIWSNAMGDASTRSGWSGEIRKLERGMVLDEAPIIFKADPDDMLVRAYVLRDPKSGSNSIFISRYFAIGKEQVIRLSPNQILPTPVDTEVRNTTSHFAYLVNALGGQSGALHLGRIDSGESRVIFIPSERVAVDASSLLLLDDWCLYVVMDNLQPTLFALDLSDPDAISQPVPLPETTDNIYVRLHDANQSIHNNTLQLHINGFLCSPRSYLFDMANGIDGIEWRKIWQEPEAFDASGMSIELLEATSEDGTKIPYHLVLPKTFKQGELPVMLYGYGGYGTSLFPYYSQLNGALWLARGGAFAMAHIRGGGEFGPKWHTRAKGTGRNKAFEDFAAIASDLVKRGYSRPKDIAAHGSSNGGLLCGVMLTRYPERFGAIWASVGVYDMLHYHNFPAGRGWIDEYGDPDDPKARVWLQAYSPIHQIEPAATRPYPPTLIDTSSSDDRVDPSHSRRFVAALQAQGHKPWFVEYEDGGHGGGGNAKAEAREMALGISFLRNTLMRSVESPEV